MAGEIYSLDNSSKDEKLTIFAWHEHSNKNICAHCAGNEIGYLSLVNTSLPDYHKFTFCLQLFSFLQNVIAMSENYILTRESDIFNTGSHLVLLPP